MLAIFHKSFAHPPPELKSPEHNASEVLLRRPAKHPEEILRELKSSHPRTAFSVSFSGGAALASASPDSNHFSLHQRRFCALEDVYCLFVGSLYNLSSLMRDYGLKSKTVNEPLLLIEAYRTLRDRGPYPADQVLAQLNGSFAFVIYDHKSRTIFVAVSSDGAIPLYWGLAAEGSMVISDSTDFIKASCGKSFAPFPPGCMFHSEGGLKSFEHPMHTMKAMPRVDSEGTMCGASFKVDNMSRIRRIPHVDSSSNWASREDSQ